MTRARFSLLWTPRTVGESSLHCLFCAWEISRITNLRGFHAGESIFQANRRPRIIVEINLGRRLEENAICCRTGSVLAEQVRCAADWCTQLWWITIYYGLMLGSFLCLLFYVSHKTGCTCEFCGIPQRLELCKFMFLEKPLAGKTYVKHLSRSAGNPQFSFHRSEIRCKCD